MASVFWFPFERNSVISKKWEETKQEVDQCQWVITSILVINITQDGLAVQRTLQSSDGGHIVLTECTLIRTFMHRALLYTMIWTYTQHETHCTLTSRWRQWIIRWNTLVERTHTHTYLRADELVFYRSVDPCISAGAHTLTAAGTARAHIHATYCLKEWRWWWWWWAGLWGACAMVLRAVTLTGDLIREMRVIFTNKFILTHQCSHCSWLLYSRKFTETHESISFTESSITLAWKASAVQTHVQPRSTAARIQPELLFINPVPHHSSIM